MTCTFCASPTCVDDCTASKNYWSITMTKPSLIARCTMSEQCLPDTPYRAMLCKLHQDMLDEIDRLKSAQPVPVQEPVSGVVLREGLPTLLQDKHIKENDKRLYTSPPAAQKPWVGLTDDEMYWNCPNWLSHEQCKTWVQQIEAKLKEMNT